MKYFASFFLMSTATFASVQSPNEEIKLCESTKEYITVYRYLDAQKAFALKKEDIMKLADNASKGCSGAARRFIEVNDLLVKASVETSDALKLAMKFTNKDDLVTNAFTTIFKETFLKEYLDLDLKDSIDFALKLSVESSGDPKRIKNDFQKIVKFCLEQSGLDLSGPKCSELAGKVATSGVKFQTEMSSSFLDHFNYLTDKAEADLPTYKALDLSLKLINAGPLSVNNFKDAYKFATSKTGLDLGKVEAINYAELMAQRSMSETKIETKK